MLKYFAILSGFSNDSSDFEQSNYPSPTSSKILNYFNWSEIQEGANSFRKRYDLDDLNSRDSIIHDFIHYHFNCPPEPNDGGVIYYEDGFKGNYPAFPSWEDYMDKYNAGVDLRKRCYL